MPDNFDAWDAEVGGVGRENREHSVTGIILRAMIDNSSEMVDNGDSLVFDAKSGDGLEVNCLKSA